MKRIWDGGMGGEGVADEDDPFRNRDCYEFNEKLDEDCDDARCDHCKKFLTLHCEHIEEFIEEEDDG